MARTIHHKEGFGFSARIVQANPARFRSVTMDAPTIILVDHGRKLLFSGAGEIVLDRGQAIAIAGGRSFDITNTADERGDYQARWISFDETLVRDFASAPLTVPALDNHLVIKSPEKGFLNAFEAVHAGIEGRDFLPDPILAHRMKELLAWLELHGGGFAPAGEPSLGERIAALLNRDLARDWESSEVARHFARSEASLRRHLAKEGLSFSEILLEARLSRALSLLLNTDRSVEAIALEVGYSTSSRFAQRFKERFGQSPSILRENKRNLIVSV